MKKSEVIEITTFKLNGYTCKQFIEANVEIDQFLKRQPGFQSRKIMQQKDGTVVDMLIWGTVENGTESMHRLMDELSDSPVHNMINQNTVSWNIGVVEHALEINA
ncbi:hypothetical protein [Dyadobacter psychrotolerans]|uniref:ABM domain-containing protein n=1 Tax=Dyadobacter psychrotolerans TaxID=2541721 RepID=A0A4R5DMP7_9BACT|nr:hypothetical protein [Dyadobacter psychrotolerans]TDE15566.1 hypothetical protein E0F88_13770 [Dyadobacter psychrotolerans]